VKLQPSEHVCMAIFASLAKNPILGTKCFYKTDLSPIDFLLGKMFR